MNRKPSGYFSQTSRAMTIRNAHSSEIDPEMSLSAFSLPSVNEKSLDDKTLASKANRSSILRRLPLYVLTNLLWLIPATILFTLNGFFIFVALPLISWIASMVWSAWNIVYQPLYDLSHRIRGSWKVSPISPTLAAEKSSLSGTAHKAGDEPSSLSAQDVTSCLHHIFGPLTADTVQVVKNDNRPILSKESQSHPDQEPLSSMSHLRTPSTVMDLLTRKSLRSELRSTSSVPIPHSRLRPGSILPLSRGGEAGSGDLDAIADEAATAREKLQPMNDTRN
jgi:hypothetical protein